MITKEKEINNIIVCYEEEYGMNYDQEILAKISLDNNYFKTPQQVVPILDIFLNEKIDGPCYNECGFLIEEELKENPELIKKTIKKHIKNY